MKTLRSRKDCSVFFLRPEGQSSRDQIGGVPRLIFPESDRLLKIDPHVRTRGHGPSSQRNREAMVRGSLDSHQSGNPLTRVAQPVGVFQQSSPGCLRRTCDICIFPMVEIRVQGFLRGRKCRTPPAKAERSCKLARQQRAEL